MNPNGCKLAVFDLDGTLNRTDLFSVPAIQEVQRELGFPVCTPEKISSAYGTAFQEFMSILFPGGDEQTAKDYERLIPAAEKKYLHLAQAYPRIPEMLQSLKGLGFQTAVCSNSNDRYISTALKAIGIFDLIDHIQELEPGMQIKSESLGCLLKKQSPSAAVMVGDTLFDARAAKDNGIPFIGCRYGFRPYEMEQVELSVNTPEELLDWIVKLTTSPEE